MVLCGDVLTSVGLTGAEPGSSQAKRYVPFGVNYPFFEILCPGVADSDAPEGDLAHTKYERERKVSQVLAAIPARVIHAAMDEPLPSTESSHNLHLAVSRAIEMPQDT